jgi:hypothetical protein
MLSEGLSGNQMIQVWRQQNGQPLAASGGHKCPNCSYVWSGSRARQSESKAVTELRSVVRELTEAVQSIEAGCGVTDFSGAAAKAQYLAYLLRRLAESGKG